ncbi:FUSC family protein [Janthinobacterium agaricidamnosum]|uniref:Integral membrane bound transporter domain-containing protein n=1 Tax=Janthinobacterium agaricidamnosum NBRC 102515 = DSM 9628 TaxID=1349767 RepID=W0VBA6_9BURK|nr:FUSC family protein [Janthinobacterium agaricidamnosum]CDG85161.1 conserved hypothetical protein [Janthinobacterium agaricidamnosum NBRC 102515 = DSM 9628]
MHVSGDSLARHRPSWLAMLSVDEANLSEGLRAACASSAMLVLGLVLGQHEFAWAAIGAFWTCLADAAGTRRMRFASMTGFALCSTLGGGISAYAASLGWFPAACAVLFFSWAGALARIWGAAAAQAAILAATACVVMVTHPLHSWPHAVYFLGVYLFGCLFATVLSFTVWRIHPFAASRRAVRAAYSRLAGIARDNARFLRRGALAGSGAVHGARLRSETRAALEAARQALAALPPSRTGKRKIYDQLLIALSDAERIFAYLIAVTHACEREQRRLRGAERAVRSLESMAELLRRMGLEIDRMPELPPLLLQRRLDACGRRLAAALGELLPLKLNVEVFELGIEQAEELPWRQAAAAELSHAWLALKSNASTESLGWRHAARVGLATLAAFLVTVIFKVPFGYWATMATLLIMQPSVATTWPRGIERVAGSMLGALLAVLIGLAVQSPLAISLVVFPLICACMALRRVSYSLHVMFMTPAFVLVADYAAPANELVYAMSRFGNNVLGCLFALLATFYLWPSRETENLEQRLSAAVSANLKYLLAVMASGGKWDAGIAALRRQAGLASNNAEQVCQRLRIERRGSAAGMQAAMRTLALLRRVAGSSARISLSPRAVPAGPLLLRWTEAVSADIDSLLRGEPAGPAIAFDAPDPDPLQADAVAQIILLRVLLLEHLANPAKRA